MKYSDIVGLFTASCGSGISQLLRKINKYNFSQLRMKTKKKFETEVPLWFSEEQYLEKILKKLDEIDKKLDIILEKLTG